MMKAPDKIWVAVGPRLHDMDARNYKEGDDYDEYHLARPNQPCSTDEFLRRLQSSDYSMHGRNKAVEEWLSSDFTAAMEGLE